MSSAAAKSRKFSRFVLIGEHPAIDFANTVVLSEGALEDRLGFWSDMLDWLSATGLSESPALKLPVASQPAALEKILALRQQWKAELPRLAAGSKLTDAFLHTLNHLLAADPVGETLERNGRKGFCLVRSASSLQGAELVLAILARQIAQFLAEAQLEHLHHCANTESCVLYFYDTTKNHRRQWCSVASCGNRHKVAAFRQRQATAKAAK